MLGQFRVLGDFPGVSEDLLGLSGDLFGLLGPFRGFAGTSSWDFLGLWGTFLGLLRDLLGPSGGLFAILPPPLSPLLPPFWAIKGHPTIMPCNYMRVCSFLSEPNNVTHVCSLELTSASRATICVSVHWN